MKMTATDVSAHQARHGFIMTEGSPRSGATEGPESKLHAQILEECRTRGWIALHGSMAKRTYRTLGEFDMTILANEGRVFFVEMKTRTGKLTQEQAILHHSARWLGHNPAVVRSMAEFLEVVR